MRKRLQHCSSSIHHILTFIQPFHFSYISLAFDDSVLGEQRTPRRCSIHNTNQEFHEASGFPGVHNASCPKSLLSPTPCDVPSEISNNLSKLVHKDWGQVRRLPWSPVSRETRYSTIYHTILIINNLTYALNNTILLTCPHPSSARLHLRDYL